MRLKSEKCRYMYIYKYLYIYMYICFNFSKLMSAKLKWCVDGCVPSPLYLLPFFDFPELE